MSQDHFGPRPNSSSVAAPPKPRRLYRLPDDYEDVAPDSHPPALHVSKVRKHEIIINRYHMISHHIYRVTIQVVTNLLFDSKTKVLF